MSIVFLPTSEEAIGTFHISFACRIWALINDWHLLQGRLLSLGKIISTATWNGVSLLSHRWIAYLRSTRSSQPDISNTAQGRWQDGRVETQHCTWMMPSTEIPAHEWKSSANFDVISITPTLSLTCHFVSVSATCWGSSTWQWLRLEETQQRWELSKSYTSTVATIFPE